MVKFIRYNKIFRFYEFIQPHIKYSLPVEDKLPAKNALVIAPHLDDESIGCGGTIYLHTKSGGIVDVLFCTSDNETRRKEAENASKILGIRDKLFFDFPIESLDSQRSLPDKLIQLFELKKPDIVFVPFWLDNHTDHRAVNKALIAISNKKKYDFLIYSYPVWFPLYPNVLIDIGAVWQEKSKAIGCYQSQTATRDYVTMSRALSQYWARAKSNNLELVETFFRATFSEYVRLGKSILK